MGHSGNAAPDILHYHQKITFMIREIYVKKHRALLSREIYLTLIYLNDSAPEQESAIKYKMCELDVPFTLVGKRDKNYMQLRKSRLENSPRKHYSFQ